MEYSVKTTAYLGLAAGFFGILSATGFFVTVMVHAILLTVLIFFVGHGLFGFQSEMGCMKCP
jgi:hypothetical protein